MSNILKGLIQQGIAGLVNGAGQLLGTNTNDNAASGYVGETITASVIRTSGASVTTGTAKTVTSILLTPGDWVISGAVGYDPTTTITATILVGAVSLTTNALPATSTLGAPAGGEYQSQNSFASNVIPSDQVVIIPSFRVSISVSDDFFLVGQASFTAGSANVYGFIQALRIR